VGDIEKTGWAAKLYDEVAMREQKQSNLGAVTEKQIESQVRDISKKVHGKLSREGDTQVITFSHGRQIRVTVDRSINAAGDVRQMADGKGWNVRINPDKAGTDTIFHETTAGHAAWDMMTKNEQRILMKALGTKDEESTVQMAAEMYSKGELPALEKSAKSLATRAWEKLVAVWDFVTGKAFREATTARGVFGQMGSGRLLRRGAEPTRNPNLRQQAAREDDLDKEIRARSPSRPIVHHSERTFVDKAAEKVGSYTMWGQRPGGVMRVMAPKEADRHDDLSQQAMGRMNTLVVEFGESLTKTFDKINEIDPDKLVLVRTGNGQVKMTNAEKMTLAAQAMSAGYGGEAKNPSAKLRNSIGRGQVGRKGKGFEMKPEHYVSLVRNLTPAEKGVLRSIDAEMEKIANKVEKEFKRANPDGEFDRRSFYVELWRNSIEAGVKSRADKATLSRGLLHTLGNPENPSIIKALTGDSRSAFVIMDIRDMLTRHSMDAAKYIGLNPFSEYLKKTWGNPEVMRAISDTKGENYGKLISRYVEGVGGEVDLRYDPGFALARKVLKNASRARLLQLPILKQWVSMFNYLPEFGVDAFKAGMIVDKKVVSQVLAHNEYLNTRGMAGNWEPTLADGTKGLTRGASAFGRFDKGMDTALRGGMKWGDNQAVHRGIMMAKFVVDKTWTGAKGTDAYWSAIGKKAATATVRTQVATDALNRSQIGREHNILLRGLNYMYGAREANHSLMVTAYGEYRSATTPAEKTAARTKLAQAAFSVILAQAFFITLINSGRRKVLDLVAGVEDDEDEKEKAAKNLAYWADSMISSNLGNIPASNVWQPFAMQILSPDPKKRWYYREKAGRTHPLASVALDFAGFFDSARTYQSNADKARTEKTFKARQMAERSADRAALRMADKAIEVGSNLFGVPANQLWRIASHRKRRGL